MNPRYLKAAGILASPLLLTGCIDKNYDLDDVDTTSRISVNNLTVPLQLQTIELENILKLDDNENINVSEINGRKVYAIEKGGTIETDRVSVNPVHIEAPAIAPTRASVSLQSPSAAPRKRAASLPELRYQLSSELTADFALRASGIDEALVAISSVESVDPITFSLDFTLPQAVASLVGKVSFENVRISLPKGLLMADGSPATVSVGSYNPSDGLLTISNAEVPFSGNAIRLSVSAQRLDAAMAGIAIKDHAIDYSGKAGMQMGGTIVLAPKSGLSVADFQLPASFDFEGRYALSSFNVASFSGEIDYALKGIDIAPIDLSNLPDFLNSPETKVIIGNPQIYLSALNTTADYHTGLSGYISLNSFFGDLQSATQLSPLFTIDWNRGVTYYNVAMAPDISALDLEASYPEAERLEFRGLSNILTLDTPAGLPKQVRIDLPDLRFHGNAVNFPVRHGWNTSAGEIDGLRGNYTFYAPLAFGEGSKVVYSKQETGFGDEDLDKLNVQYLNVSAHAVTTIPLEVEVTLVPLDATGRAIGHTVQSIVLPPNADQDITLRVEALPGSTIAGLDGVDYVATIRQTSSNGQALSPDMTITLSNLRMTVDGYYETDF